MDDPLKQIEALAAQARKEPVPGVGVSTEVLRRIRLTTEDNNRPLAIFTLGSIGAAIASLIATIPLINGMIDPLSALFAVVPVLAP